MRVSILVSILITSTHGALPTEMTSLLDEKMNPCIDFYKYSCGNWLKHTVMPRSSSSTLKYNEMDRSQTRIDSSTTVIDTHIDHVVEDMIDQKKSPILTTLYDSCMNMKELNLLNNRPLQNDLKRIYHAQRKDELMMLVGDFARTGGSAFVQFNVAPDPLNTKLQTLILKPVLTLPNSNYYDHPVLVEAYEDYISKLIMLGTSTKKRKRNQDPQHDYKRYSSIVLEIEKELNKIQTFVGETISPKTIQQASTLWPHIFMKYSHGMQLSRFNRHIVPDLKIYGSVQYLNQIEAMIQRKPLEELKAYIMFRMIHSRVQWLGAEYDTIWYVLFRRLIKKQFKHIPRDRICRDRLRKYLPDLIGHHLVTKSYDQKTKVLEMIQLIQNAMEKRINRWKWMEEQEEKDKAKDKLYKLTTLIGLSSKIPQSYPFTLTIDNYPANMYKIMSHSFDEEMKKVGKARNPEEWSVSSTEINAQYIRDRNTIELPIGVLQPPFLKEPSAHPARSFGALGALIGHELIHGFDAKGSSYDGEGNERPWWDLNTAMGFKHDSKCFKVQYSAMIVQNKPVNGEITLAENIADNGGAVLAWDAYREYITRITPDTNKLDTDNGDKMFFISFAQMFCERVRENALSNRYTWNHRLPAQARVNGVIMNHPAFATTFQCQHYQPMNPHDKCVLF